MGGEYVSTIGADGSFLNERLAWQFRVATPEGAVVTTIDSSDPGTYSVEGDQITINDPGGEATIRFQLEVGGQLQDFPVAPQQTPVTEAISGTGPFTCDGDVLRASVNPREEAFVVEAVWDRS